MAKTKLADPGATLSVLPTTEEQQRDARAYMTRKGHEDLLPMMGLEAEDRQPEPPCPTCGVHKGRCESGMGKPMHRWHIARARVKEQRVAADELLDSILGEIGDQE